MTEFAIGMYGSSDYRLIRNVSGVETTIGTWSQSPTFEMCLNGLADFHGSGSQPFGTREAVVESHILSQKWPLNVRDMTLPDETLPWNDEEYDI